MIVMSRIERAFEIACGATGRDQNSAVGQYLELLL